jgi:hypothetical protein
MTAFEDPRLEAFCQHIASGHSEADSYRRAGYKPHHADRKAATLANTPPIKARLAEIASAREKFVAQAVESPVPTKEWVIQQLVALVEICTAKKLVKQTVVVERRSGPPTVYEVEVTAYDAAVAFRALELLGRYAGMCRE